MFTICDVIFQNQAFVAEIRCRVMISLRKKSVVCKITELRKQKMKVKINKIQKL